MLKKKIKSRKIEADNMTTVERGQKLESIQPFMHRVLDLFVCERYQCLPKGLKKMHSVASAY